MFKTHIHVGTIGHIDHGKTTLTVAITQVAAARFGGTGIVFEQIDKAPVERRRGITINLAHVEYESSCRTYAHVDCPGHADFVKNMITGASQMDGAILLVDGTQGVEAQTREHVLLARQLGVGHIVVFVNKVDIADPELVELVVLEATALAEAHGYADTPVVTGSALVALEAVQSHRVLGDEVRCIEELIAALDRHIPDPVRDRSAPFLMCVESVCTIPGRGTVVTGRVSRGMLRKGGALEIVGGDAEAREVVVSDIQSFHRPLDEAIAGQSVGLLLRGVGRGEVARGQSLAARGSVRPRQRGTAEVFLLTKAEGGRHTPFFDGYRPQFFFGTGNVTGTLELPEPLDMLHPGDHARVRFHLDRPIGVEEGVRFAIREGSRTIGAGIVIGLE